MREIVNAIFYVMRGGIEWCLLPSDFQPWSTVNRWSAAWRDSCIFEKIDHALVMADRERTERAASPTAAITDGQRVKTTEAGSLVVTTPATRSRVVERFLDWINRNRRLAKNFEATIGSARAFLYAA